MFKASNATTQKSGEPSLTSANATPLPEIVCITTYPPRECGIATYSSDLIDTIQKKFGTSFKITVCPLISKEGQGATQGVFPIIDLREPDTFTRISEYINTTANVKMVLIQHEFGLYRSREADFMSFLAQVNVPLIIAFHTVLPNHDDLFRKQVKKLSVLAKCISVMTARSAEILETDYDIKPNKIVVIPHGTHLVKYQDRDKLKEKYDLVGKKVLSTFGLLGPGKSIETTLDALPQIVNKNENIIFLIIGKTHPSLVKEEGEQYRDMLKDKIKNLSLENHVRFVDRFLDLPVLLDYLQLSDIYLFTSKDRNQAVSGTFSYAISCGCPIISTPIPHAKEVLKENMGIIVDFENPEQLSAAVNRLFEDTPLRKAISKNEIQATAPSAWENVAITHASLFKKLGKGEIKLNYSLPEIKLDHLKRMTTDFGIIQFCELNRPNIDSGYTLDDNARALVAVGDHYKLTKDADDLEYIKLYFNFIKHCFQHNARFLNYVDEQGTFTPQNEETNLEDANGRAIWALGYLYGIKDELPAEFSSVIEQVNNMLEAFKQEIPNMYSTRAMAFIIKGLYFKYKQDGMKEDLGLVVKLADRMVQMYLHEQQEDWHWFESYMTYGNSILAEALLCAWELSGKKEHKEIAQTSFNFLLSKIMTKNGISVISNQGWLYRDKLTERTKLGGEQPIDVAYTILALARFHEVFPENNYDTKMRAAFNWFLGDNHLKQIIYNPRTGGCYDGLEEHNVNLNQGAESTVSYLLSRFACEKFLRASKKAKGAKTAQAEISY